jgi:hypothetical protein
MLYFKKELICKIKDIGKKHQYCDMNDFFNCKFDMLNVTWPILTTHWKLHKKYFETWN